MASIDKGGMYDAVMGELVDEAFAYAPIRLGETTSPHLREFGARESWRPFDSLHQLYPDVIEVTIALGA
jgi:hypothetical protein